MAPRTGDQKPPVKGAPATSMAEWIVAIASTIMVLAVLGYLIYDGVRSPRTPPGITIEIDSVRAAGPGYLVLFHAQNRGRTTAAEVVIEGELEADSGRVERSETTLDYVPAEGQQGGGLYFRNDPRRLRLRLRAQGYREP